MKTVVIVHYHLRRGGVTRVIETAAECLRKAGIRHLILSGSEPESGRRLPVRVIPRLDYRDPPAKPVRPESLLRSMRNAVREEFGSGEFVWHLHNPSLGINPTVTSLVRRLAESGDPMVLQHHDFAEDGRPEHHAAIVDPDAIYPIAPQIRHAFINSRNARQLVAAGLPPGQADVLPNAITMPARTKPPTRRPEHPLLLYPVRGIRRKNLGELFLLARLSPAGTRFATTLAPANPRWQPIHRDWLDYAEETGLPVMLGAVERLAPAPRAGKTFASWIRHATHFVTTSVSEGFGLGFLEPATLGKPLIGRHLATLGEDFALEGIQPGRLYDRLLVPEKWVGLERLRQRLVSELQRNLELYGLPMSNEFLNKSFAAMRHRGHLDFGNLPEDLQRRVLRKLADPKTHGEVLVESGTHREGLAGWLAAALAETRPTVRPGQLGAFTPEAYRRRLVTCLQSAAHAEPRPPQFLEGHQVLAQFLKPGSFHFLCT